MSKVIHIKSFLFDKARYLVNDGFGDIVLLTINYKTNSFTLRSSGIVKNELFLTEIKEVAAKLLSKKHNINRVDSLEK